jgi:regulator of sigma E protease
MMIAINIILGLIGLGIIVFFHELGHFVAARLVGVKVEAFSIGWGNPILKKKIGMVEYRLGMFPIGGYCKMHGENDYNIAWENMRNGIKPEKGTYLAASPAARILISFGGPFFNLLFAILLLSILWGVGFQINTVGNRIILASEISDQTFPADISGFQTGDRIIDINGRKISFYHEIQENIALNPERLLPVIVERDGKIVQLEVTPSLDKSSGAGRIGIFFWIDPVIESVKEGSPASLAGLRPQDIIISVNDQPVRNTEDFRRIRSGITGDFTVEYERNNVRGKAEFNIDNLESELGFSWETIRYRTPRLSVPAAIVKGARESYKTLTVSITSLRLLFKGIDLTQAVSGPIRITYMMGDMATQGFGQGVGIGLQSIINFLALISIALCVMNMLPLPILDGGMIILFFVEMIRGKPIPPKAVSVFNACGMAIIFSLMILAVFGDIMFFARR